MLSSFISVSQATFYTFLTVLCGTVIWFLKQGNFNDLLNAFTVTKDGNHSVHWIFASLYFVCCWMTNGQWIAYSASILQLLHMLLFCFLDMWSSQIWGCSGIYITCASVSVSFHPRNSYILECKLSLGLRCCMFTNMWAYKHCWQLFVDVQGVVEYLIISNMDCCSMSLSNMLCIGSLNHFYCQISSFAPLLILSIMKWSLFNVFQIDVVSLRCKTLFDFVLILILLNAMTSSVWIDVNMAMLIF